ncbi:V-type ATP synthase subunit I [Halobacteriales archaeon SW_6_65_46]|nr:MAG: V-type ATP synthase subunit I [Halobacteriales archaeon SW_6_65_46]
MLRPERMSRVSVTGSKGVMDEVVETIYDLQLFDITDYDGEWAGFQPGDPVEGAAAAAERLVTVRSLASLLDVDADEFTGEPLRLDDDFGDRLDTVRSQVNELDDRREELEDELRGVEESLDTVEPFVELGIDLDLLQGYDSLSVVVGQGDRDAVRRTLVDADGVEQYELFGEGETLAAFVAPAETAVSDALVSAEFTQLEVPETDADPEGYIAELEETKARVESELAEIEAELAALADEHAAFLLAAEERLRIDVQKREAPLSFATTSNAFVAEGWLPAERYLDLAEGLRDRVGDHVEIEELEQAEYEDGHARDHSEGSEETVAADGGQVEQPMSGGTPPVVQDNPGPVNPFEALVGVLNKPKYSELDPTIIFFLTFPIFFGFMIGDLGYGLIYIALGYGMMQLFDSDIMRALGAVGLLSGLFTAVFGVLYGELFGLHQLGYIIYPNGSPPMHKGLQPHYLDYGLAWLLLSVVVGVFHLVVGRVFDFVNNLNSHGVREALLESGSWIVFTISLWTWMFSHTAVSSKPEFMFTSFASAGQMNPVTGETITSSDVVYSLGFNGFSPIDVFSVGSISIDAVLLVVVASLALIIKVEGGIGIIESITQGFGHVISYTRIAAVLLAKAGMALAVNLLVFGAYTEGGEFHLIFFSKAVPESEVVFAGLLNGDGPVALLLGGVAGILVLVFGHLLVLVLGVTSAGLQAVRLEYVEFFGKFYEGGGRDYTPFGHERRFTSDE